jgi:hypothetical protein
MPSLKPPGPRRDTLSAPLVPTVDPTYILIGNLITLRLARL